MSASESVRATLEAIGFVQLVLLFATLIAYGMALSEAFSARTRGAAAVVSFVAAAGFSAATSAFAEGVVLIALAVGLVGVFAAAAWLLASLLHLDSPGSARSAETGRPQGSIAPRVVDAAALQPRRAAARPS